MHPAPAVTVQCGDGGAWRLSKAVLMALAAAAFAAWALSWAGWAAAPAALGAALAAALASGWGWSRGQDLAALLCWDQQRWTLRTGSQAEAVPGQVTVALDLGRWLLLRFCPMAGASTWLPLSAGRLAASAGPLRAALYAESVPGTARDAASGGPA